MAAGDIVPAVVTGFGANGSAHLRIGGLSADLQRQGFQWTRRTSANDLVTVGNLIEV